MNVKGDLVNNWEFFKQQWQGYSVATGLNKQEQKIRLATLRSAMRKDCLQKLSSEQQQDIHECIEGLEAKAERRLWALPFQYVPTESRQTRGWLLQSFKKGSIDLTTELTERPSPLFWNNIFLGNPL